MKKRVLVETGIFIVIPSNGKLNKNCFEVVKVRTMQNIDEAMKLFKSLFCAFGKGVYLYSGKTGYRVEFKQYTDSYINAQNIKRNVEYCLGVFEGA